MLLLRDSFADVDSTALGSHAMVDTGHAWTVHAGAADIQGNRANTTTATMLASAEANRSAVVLTCILRPVASTDSSDIGVLLRLVDGSNYWMVSIDPLSDRLTIFQNVAGAFTSRATQNTTIIAQDYLLRATCFGQTITAQLDNNAPIAYTSATVHQTGTRYGIRGGVVGQKFDDFEVRSL